MADTNTSSGGIGFFGLLTIALIILKLLGKIKISWWWIWAPIWGPIALILAIIAVVCIGCVVIAIIDEISHQADKKRLRK